MIRDDGGKVEYEHFPPCQCVLCQEDPRGSPGRLALALRLTASWWPSWPGTSGPK